MIQCTIIQNLLRVQNFLRRINAFSAFVNSASSNLFTKIRNAYPSNNILNPQRMHLHSTLRNIHELLETDMKSCVLLLLVPRDHPRSAGSAKAAECLERSLASIAMRYCCITIGCFILASCFQLNTFLN